MAGLFQYFWLFVWKVGSHTVTLAAGCIVTVVIGLLEKYVLKRPISLRSEIAILLAFVFFACFEAWRDQYVRVTALTQPPAPEIPMLVNCEMLLHPVPWDNQPLYVIQFPYSAGIGPANLTSATGRRRTWPEEPNAQLFNRLYRCALTNYGSQTVFDFVAEFGFAFAEALRDSDRNPKAERSGPVIAQQTNPVRVPVLDKNGGTFVFYIYNLSKYFVTVLKPRFATVELEGKEGQRQIRLKQSGPDEPKPFFLSPRTQ